MNPVLKRTLTGLTIGAVVIGAILLAPVKAIVWTVSALMALALLEFFTLLRLKTTPTPTSTSTSTPTSISTSTPTSTSTSTSTNQSINRLIEKSINSQSLPCLLLLLLLGAAILALGLSALAAIAVSFGNLMLLYTVAIIKFSDVGGFAFGLTSAKLMKGGNHKLCPTISPGKSWEGLVGSIVFSTLVSLAFMPATHFAPGKAALFGLAAAILGTTGDLIESKFKRWVGVKDSSTWKLTNGMGGILDMLDSLLIAPAVIYFFI